MNKTAVRSVAIGTVTIVTIIVGYLGSRDQLNTARESLNPSNGQFTAHEREQALLVCLKTQADGCYTE
jgi:hypothetical protein